MTNLETSRSSCRLPVAAVQEAIFCDNSSGMDVGSRSGRQNIERSSGHHVTIQRSSRRSFSVLNSRVRLVWGSGDDGSAIVVFSKLPTSGSSVVVLFAETRDTFCVKCMGCVTV